jgi:hypothetical protein
VFVGSHYPGDIAGSLLVALAATIAVWVLRGVLEMLIEPILRLCTSLRLANAEDVPYPAALAGR